MIREDKAPRLGQVVRSKAGRDQGRAFVIVEIVDDQFVLVADGSLRRLDKPKRKKLKHLELTPLCCESIGEKLAEGKKIFDAEIRSQIEAQTGRRPGRAGTSDGEQQQDD